jgi:NAD-dependent deacetylase
LKEVEPNLGHLILAELETDFEVYIITQNVDDLHERAGSSNVLHLHGELLKVRSTKTQITFWIGRTI